MKNRLTFFILFLTFSMPGLCQTVIPLYDTQVPNSIPTKDTEHWTSYNFLQNVTQPTLTMFLPAKTQSSTAVIVIPGGGYAALNIHYEGYDVAKRLNELGITAFVLKYRLPDDKIMPDKSIGPIEDAQKALLIVKTRAKEWNIDTSKIGVMGFSAGGHLAAFIGTHFNKAYIENTNRVSLRPSFMILVYPVISFTDSLGHLDSRRALIGANPPADRIKLYSNELNVSPDTPPTFLIHAEDDGLVSVKNSTAMFLALQKNKVPAGLHIYPTGQHGFYLEPAKSTWFDYCARWLKEHNWY
jgi:acetyl esterase/lipase